MEVYIEVTYRCNLRCLQCYNPVNRLSDKELSSQEIKYFIDLLADAGCIWLNFTGGEPFIREDFFEFYSYAMRKGLICSIQTNGTLITKNIALMLSENPPYYMDITVYGANRQTYKTLTCVAEAFDACIEGIDNLLSVGIKPCLKTTVTKHNKQDIWAIKALADVRGLNYIYDPHIHPRIDGDKSPQSLRLSPQEAAEVTLAETKHHKSWKEYLECYLNEPNPGNLVICGALEDGFWINPYGALKICAIVPKPTYDLRNGGTLEEAWDTLSDYIKVQEQRKKENNPCLKCKLFSFCGHCIGWSELEHQDWNREVDYLCQIAHLQETGLKNLGLWPAKGVNDVKKQKVVSKT